MPGMDSALVYAAIAAAVILTLAISVVALRRRGGAQAIEPAASAALAVETREVETSTIVLELEVPEPAAGRLRRLRTRLARSNSAIGQGLLALLSRDTIDAATWEEIEESLLLADLGVGPTNEIIERLRTALRVEATL